MDVATGLLSNFLWINIILLFIVVYFLNYKYMRATIFVSAKGFNTALTIWMMKGIN